jgi:hypothetical protein
MKMYNYFTTTTERSDGKRLYSTVYRAPVGHTHFSDTTEHYMGGGRWGLATSPDPQHPGSGHRLVNPGAHRFPADGKRARAFMRRVARQERGK